MQSGLFNRSRFDQLARKMIVRRPWYVGVGGSFTMEFHSKGTTGNDAASLNPQFVERVAFINDHIIGTITLQWIATNTLTGVHETGFVNVQGTNTVIDPSISFNSLEVIGYSGSGQGVRLTDAVVSTTVLPADENYQFNVSGVDQDGDTTSSHAFNIHITGGDGSSYSLTGTSGDDVLAGSSVVDHISGGAGSDIVDYRDDTSGVTVNLNTNSGTGGEAQGDTYSSIEGIMGGSGNDHLIGNSVVGNYLDGGHGNDTLNGGSGNDTLIGGLGSDILVGGDGNDKFVWKIGDADHSIGQDKLDLADVLNNSAGESLDNYLDFSKDGGNAVLQVFSHGDGNTSTTPDVTIIMDGLGSSDQELDDLQQYLLNQDGLVK